MVIKFFFPAGAFASTPLNCGVMANNQLIIMKTSHLHVESTSTNYKQLVKLLALLKKIKFDEF